jgi:uncharacterized protein (UPF0333 family)
MWAKKTSRSSSEGIVSLEFILITGFVILIVLTVVPMVFRQTEINKASSAAKPEASSTAEAYGAS